MAYERENSVAGKKKFEIVRGAEKHRGYVPYLKHDIMELGTIRLHRWGPHRL